MVAVDCDGVLTDGIYQISSVIGEESPVVTKSFYTRDFYALQKIMERGISVVIATQSHDAVIIDQVNRISSHSDIWRDSFNSGHLQVWTGIGNKIDAVHCHLLTRNDLGWHNVAYIGDAENDLACMKKSKWTGCPSDAIQSIKDNANYISDYPGGKGAVYDFCMHILDRIEKENR